MTTLAEAMLATADTVAALWRSLAQTGSDEFHIVDTTLRAPSSILTNGTVWFLSGALAGKSAIVTGHSGEELSYPEQADPVAAGDAYAASALPRHLLVQAINAALRDLGELTYIDVSLATVAGTQDYELPAGVSNVVAVRLDERKWITRFDVLNTGYLHFEDPVYGAYDVELYHNLVHPQLVADDDLLAPGVNMERFAWEVAEWIRRIKLQGGTPADDDPLLTLMNESKDKVAAAGRHNTYRYPPPLKLRGW